MSNQIVLCGQNAAVSFGPFELLPDRGLLFRGQEQMKIGSRAFALLSILLQHAGEIVAQNTLMAHVWPDVFVHEANLKVTVSNLRRILGDNGPVPNYILTVPGRGYRFIAQVAKRPRPIAELMLPAAGELAGKLDMWLIVERKTKLRDAVAPPWPSPMISLVIPNGEDKMALAVAAANRLLDKFPDCVCFIDLSATAELFASPYMATELVKGDNACATDAEP